MRVRHLPVRPSFYFGKTPSPRDTQHTLVRIDVFPVPGVPRTSKRRIDVSENLLGCCCFCCCFSNSAPSTVGSGSVPGGCGLSYTMMLFRYGTSSAVHITESQFNRGSIAMAVPGLLMLAGVSEKKETRAGRKEGQQVQNTNQIVLLPTTENARKRS